MGTQPDQTITIRQRDLKRIKGSTGDKLYYKLTGELPEDELFRSRISAGAQVYHGGYNITPRPPSEDPYPENVVSWERAVARREWNVIGQILRIHDVSGAKAFVELQKSMNHYSEWNMDDKEMCIEQIVPAVISRVSNKIVSQGIEGCMDEFNMLNSLLSRLEQLRIDAFGRRDETISAWGKAFADALYLVNDDFNKRIAVSGNMTYEYFRGGKKQIDRHHFYTHSTLMTLCSIWNILYPHAKKITPPKEFIAIIKGAYNHKIVDFYMEDSDDARELRRLARCNDIDLEGVMLYMFEIKTVLRHKLWLN